MILSFACFAGAISIRLIDPIVPDIARDFAIDPAIVALLTTAFAFPYALGQPLLGPMADSVGKVRVLRIGLAVVAVCLLINAWAPNIELMFVARCLAGLAGGAIIPVALAMVGDRVPFDKRQVALSNLLSAMLVAQFVALIGSGVIAAWIGWRYAILGAGVITVAALGVTVWYLKPRSIDRPPLSVAGLNDAYRSVFANPRAIICYMAVFCEGLLIFGLLPFVAVMLEARGAGSIVEAGFVIAGMGAGGLAFTLSIRWILALTGGMLNTIRLGGCAVFVGFCGVAMAGPWPFELGAFFLIGLGFYAVHNALQTQATELSPDNRAAAVFPPRVFLLPRARSRCSGLHARLLVDW